MTLDVLATVKGLARYQGKHVQYILIRARTVKGGTVVLSLNGKVSSGRQPMDGELYDYMYGVKTVDTLGTEIKKAQFVLTGDVIVEGVGIKFVD